MDKNLSDPVDEQEIQDAGHIGRAIIKAARELSEKQGRPLHDFVSAAIFGLFGAYDTLVESDPFHLDMKKLEEQFSGRKRRLKRSG